jgi:hypothetical protein
MVTDTSTRPICIADYDINPCDHSGHNRYWLAGVTRLEPVPPVKAGIWRCVVCCPPLPFVKETKTLEQLERAEMPAAIEEIAKI